MNIKGRWLAQAKVFAAMIPTNKAPFSPGPSVTATAVSWSAVLKMKDNYILAFETSCDETSVAILKNGSELLCNIIASQIKSTV